MNTFTVFKRKRCTGKAYYYAQFRDPETGVRQNPISIEILKIKLGLFSATPVRSKYEAIRIAQKAFDSDMVLRVKENPLFQDYVKRFWDFDNSEYIKKRNRIKANSIGRAYSMNLLNAFVKHVEKSLPKDLKIAEVRLQHIETVENHLMESGLSNSSINRVLQSIRSPLVEAYRLGIIQTNLADKIKNFTLEESEKGIPTPEEINKLLSSLNSNETSSDCYDNMMFMIVALAATTGMRQGEIRAIEADDIEIIDNETGFIHVRHSFSRYDKMKSTKGKRTRLVVAPTSLCLELLDFKKTNPYGTKLIFWNSDNADEPISECCIKTRFEKALSAIGIDKQKQVERKITFHSLRHYYASIMSQAIGSDEAKKLLGHRNVETTDHYTHETKEHLLKLDKVRQTVIPFSYARKIGQGEKAI